MDCAVAGKGKIEKSGSKNMKSRITPSSVCFKTFGDANAIAAQEQAPHALLYIELRDRLRWIKIDAGFTQALDQSHPQAAGAGQHAAIGAAAGQFIAIFNQT